MTQPRNSWDASYQATTPPPWDIGRPQPAFVRLAEDGRLTGILLDAGCGTGENTLLAATHGAEAIGIDGSRAAIELARRKAVERSVSARFEVGDALELALLGVAFDTIIDSGLFHVFDDDARARYVTSLGAVARPDCHLYLMCFSDRQPGDFGPRRVTKTELVVAFSDGWTIDEIAAAEFAVNASFGTNAAKAWLATITKK
jgi:SAM-dependent methyltransferase